MTWKNFPIPETIVIPLAAGLVLDALIRYPLFAPNVIWVILGLLLLILGLALMFWAVREAGLQNLERPDELLTSGPYAFSRNPMYLSWLSVHLAIFFLNRSLWLLILFFIALPLTHFTAILPEERHLKNKFGETYEHYQAKVRRYF